MSQRTLVAKEQITSIGSSKVSTADTMNSDADTNTGLRRAKLEPNLNICYHTHAFAPMLDALPSRFVEVILITGAKIPVIRLKAEHSASPVPL